MIMRAVVGRLRAVANKRCRQVDRATSGVGVRGARWSGGRQAIGTPTTMATTGDTTTMTMMMRVVVGSAGGRGRQGCEGDARRSGCRRVGRASGGRARAYVGMVEAYGGLAGQRGGRATTVRGVDVVDDDDRFVVVVVDVGASACLGLVVDGRPVTRGSFG